jgi:hypothetical protein
VVDRRFLPAAIATSANYQKIAVRKLIVAMAAVPQRTQ